MSTIVDTAERPDSSVMPPWPVRRFTVAEYQHLRDAGAFAEDRVELLEGWIVPKVTHSPPHDWTVTQVQQLLTQVLPDKWLLRVQCAITTEDSEPKPDHVIAHGPNDRYLETHPCGANIGLLIEVADATLRKDRRKAAIYAAENIPVYWIINLVDRRVEVHTQPNPVARQYQDVQAFAPGESVAINLDGREIVRLPVDELLPPAQ